MRQDQLFPGSMYQTKHGIIFTFLQTVTLEALNPSHYSDVLGSIDKGFDQVPVDKGGELPSWEKTYFRVIEKNGNEYRRLMLRNKGKIKTLAIGSQGVDIKGYHRPIVVEMADVFHAPVEIQESEARARRGERAIDDIKIKLQWARPTEYESVKDVIHTHQHEGRTHISLPIEFLRSVLAQNTSLIEEAFQNRLSNAQAVMDLESILKRIQ